MVEWYLEVLWPTRKTHPPSLFTSFLSIEMHQFPDHCWQNWGTTVHFKRLPGLPKRNGRAQNIRGHEHRRGILEPRVRARLGPAELRTPTWRNVEEHDLEMQGTMF